MDGPVRVVFPEFGASKCRGYGSTGSPPAGTARSSPPGLKIGANIMVPLFVKTGDVIRVDLQAMKYMDRVKIDR